MFDAIAPRYDLLNRLISFGIDQRWRRETVAALQLESGALVLDLATGTGDLALMIARRHPSARVLGVDPSAGMLEAGGVKVERAGLADRIELSQGDAQALPHSSASVDGVCMAFGIRNVPDRAAALAEAHRVLRPGCRLAILELSEPRGGWLGPLARWHVHRVVPWLGGLLSGSGEYRYLQQSIAAFPPPEQFMSLMAAAGFEELQATRLTFGVCQLFVGRKGGAR